MHTLPGGLRAIYNIGKLGWKLRVETRDFGENFHNSMLDLSCEELAFSSSLEMFRKWTSWYYVGNALTLTGNERRREDINKKIEVMVGVFNNCYEIIQNYHNEWKNARERSAKLTKSPPKEKSALSAMNAERGKKLVAKLQEMKRQELNQQRVVVNGEATPLQPLAQAGSPLITATAKNMAKEIEEAQRNSNVMELVSWALHGKEELGKLINQLKEENKVLRRLLRNLEPSMGYDPFQKIRQSERAADLWAEQGQVRIELENLHDALCLVNVGESAVQLAVKLEENFSKTKSKLEDRTSYVSELRRRSNPMYVWLMEVNQGGVDSPTSGGIIISTTVSRYNEEVPNLAQRLTGMSQNNQRYGVIGGTAIDETHKYHLQIIERPKDLASNQKMSEVIQDNTVRREERICVAAQMALSYNHFMSIHRGTVHRHLDSYHLYGPSPPKECKGKWDPRVLRTMFVEFGFGRAVKIGDGEFPSDEEYDASEINHAVELGLLIYQVSAGKKLDYDHTRDGIARQQKTITDCLDDFERVYGSYMRDIIEVCFSNLKEDERDEKVVSEVAVALRHVATQLKNSTTNA
ncbi:hypothetical protein GQX73_g5843 [Xylaria multiplex]|uniref:Prion-inhibition and propagation HeLo domain-containing protein n=1 Tax=Xylaria multiplex TaxID=323545 RepID=A0A7C8IRB0_9PEZI|nr:hypothetical protein GQX73_g5843 [Xylaria multiplex]